MKRHKDKFGWTGTTLSMSGVALQALLPTAMIPWTYPIFICSSSIWFVNARLEQNKPNMALQFALFVLNGVAAWRHLIHGVLA